MPVQLTAPESDLRGLTLTMAPSDLAPARARAALDAVSDELPKATFETLRLLVTELITNSVRHAGLGRDEVIEFELTRSPSAVRVEVRDPGRGFNPSSRPRRDDEGGMGLMLIDKLSSRWDVNGDADTSVWFELEA